MSIDSSLCIIPPNKRKIWLDPQRFWSRDQGNCNLGSITNPGFNFIDSLQINQKNFKNLVLENKVLPKNGNGSMSNVDGRLKKNHFIIIYPKLNLILIIDIKHMLCKKLMVHIPILIHNLIY